MEQIDQKSVPITALEIWKAEGEFLKAAIAEDRVELRSNRTQIYSQCTFLAAASFAVTGFLLWKNPQGQFGLQNHGKIMLLVLDIAIVGVLAALSWRSLNDLIFARGFMEQREKMLISYLNGNSVGSPYIVSPNVKRLMNDNGVRWMPIMTTAILLTKTVVVLVLV